MQSQPTPIGRGALRKTARQFREAALLASPEESVDLDRLHRLLRQDAISVPACSALLTEVIARQHQRRQHAA